MNTDKKLMNTDEAGGVDRVGVQVEDAWRKPRMNLKPLHGLLVRQI
jgi:hypothetical protein